MKFIKCFFIIFLLFPLSYERAEGDDHIYMLIEQILNEVPVKEIEHSISSVLHDIQHTGLSNKVIENIITALNILLNSSLEPDNIDDLINSINPFWFVEYHLSDNLVSNPVSSFLQNKSNEFVDLIFLSPSEALNMAVYTFSVMCRFQNYFIQAFYLKRHSMEF